MGMSNSYQLFCFMFAVIKVLFLTSAIYQFATCKYECPPSSGKFLKWFNYQLITNKSPQQSPRFSCLPPSCWRCSQRWWSLGSSRYAQLRIITSKPSSNWTFDSFPPQKHLQLVRIYKVYSLVEKSMIIFFMIVSSFFMVELVQLYARKHYMNETEQVSVLLFHAVNGCLILLTARRFSFVLEIDWL